MNRFDLIFSSKVNSESLQGQRHRVHHFVVPPDTDLHDLLRWVWNQVDFNFFVELDVGDFDGVVEQRDFKTTLPHGPTGV